jgi:hypothetical protein
VIGFLTDELIEFIPHNMAIKVQHLRSFWCLKNLTVKHPIEKYTPLRRGSLIHVAQTSREADSPHL